MKKLINICLLLSSLIGYLQWGKAQHAFLFQVEYDLIFGRAHSSDAFMHPFVLIPLVGQLLLLLSVFQKTPGRALSVIGLLCLSTIMLLLLFIGILTKSVAITASAMPFVGIGVFSLVYKRKSATKKRNENHTENANR